MGRPNIRTSTDILRLLDRTVVDLKAGKIDNARAKTITYICSTAGQIIRNLELEKKNRRSRRTGRKEGVIMKARLKALFLIFAFQPRLCQAIMKARL